MRLRISLLAFATLLFLVTANSKNEPEPSSRGHKILNRSHLNFSTSQLESGGCTDPTACNYDATATVDDGSCEYTSCAGCTNELACNYKADVVSPTPITIKDDGSCVFPSGDCAKCNWDTISAGPTPVHGQNPMDGSGFVVSNDTDGDGVCDGNDLCEDENACNYQANPTAACDTYTTYYRDEDEDGLGDYLLGVYCNDDTPGGKFTNVKASNGWDKCVDLAACNYNDASNLDCQTDVDGDGFCDGIKSTDADGNDTYSLDLCVDTQAPNYHYYDTLNYPAAQLNQLCCLDTNLNKICDDRELYACTDSLACNYFALANLDDGNCLYNDENPSSGKDASMCDECQQDGDSIKVPNSVITKLDPTVSTTGAASDSTVFLIDKYVLHDSDEDGVCDQNEQIGCDDEDACNYLDVPGGSGADHPQAKLGDDQYGGSTDFYRYFILGTDTIDSLTVAVYITEPCSWDDALGYGVTPSGDQCSNYCKFDDACGNCGGEGVDADGDGKCDDEDNCTDIKACNYMDTLAVECKLWAEARCGCVDGGVDLNNDGIADDDESDEDNDGICDDNDDCSDENACNYSMVPTEACKYLNACGDCVSGTPSASNPEYIDNDTSDADNDGLCDADGDKCTDTSACNFDFRTNPDNQDCLYDIDPANGICDIYEIVGCDNPSACNYNAAVSKADNTSCILASAACEQCAGGTDDGTGYIVLLDSDNDGVCDNADNCSNVLAVNYDASLYGNEACCQDANQNGVCDGASEIEGCMNQDACNYNAAATIDDGSCTIPSGCDKCSWSPGTNPADGTGTLVLGDTDKDGVCDEDDECTDVTACNYVGGFEECDYPDDGEDCNGNCLSDVDNDGICDYNGLDQCYDLEACNYDAPQNVSCLFRNSCGHCVESEKNQVGYDEAVYCDCELSVRDSLGICGGNCFEDVDNDGICDNVDKCLFTEPDYCGTCGGNVTLENLGQEFDCGCFDLPEGACSCDSLGNVFWPRQARDCDGNCIYGSTINSEGDSVCLYFDNANPTILPEPTQVTTIDGEQVITTNPFELKKWIEKIKLRHDAMSSNLDDGSLSGGSDTLTINNVILDKGDLEVVGNSEFGGFVQMDTNLTVLGHLRVEKTATILGTTFAEGGIKTSSQEINGDLQVGGSANIDTDLQVLGKSSFHDTLSLYNQLIVGTNKEFTVDTLGNVQANGNLTVLDTLSATVSKALFNDVTLDTLLGNELTINNNAEIKQQLQVQDSIIGGSGMRVMGGVQMTSSLDVTGESNFTAKVRTNGGLTNVGSIESDTVNVTQYLSATQVDVQSHTHTENLTVENVSSPATFMGGLQMLNSDSISVFSIGHSNTLSQVNINGQLRMSSEVSAPNGTPADSIVLDAQTGSVKASSLLQARKLELTGTGASVVSNIAGDVAINGTATFNGGLVMTTAPNDTAVRMAYGNQLLRFSKPVAIDSALTVNGGGTISFGESTNPSTMTVHGTITGDSLALTSGLNATGSLTAGNTTVDTLTAQGITSLQGRVVIGKKDSVPHAAWVEYPTDFAAVIDAPGTNTSYGLSIRVNNTATEVKNQDKFIRFEDKYGRSVGLISGMHGDEIFNEDFERLDRDEHIVQLSFAVKDLARATFETVNAWWHAGWKAVKTAANFIPDAWQVFWPGFDWGDIVPDGADAVNWGATAGRYTVLLVHDAVRVAEYSAYMGAFNDAARGESGDYGGVAYTSGNGDYAEWMPRAHFKEVLKPRQIVGVHRGQVSLNTTEADHLMVISTAPIVLGNVPQEESIDAHEMVAFMGQVPVDVIGEVRSGDYIIPSGDNDGFGLAVHPEDMDYHTIDQIVGVAWEDGLNEYFNTVNIAVGLDNSASAQKFIALRNQLDDLKFQFGELVALANQESDVQTNTIQVNEKVSESWLKRLFKVRKPGKESIARTDGTTVTRQNTINEERTPDTESASVNGRGSVLAGMTDQDILEAFENSRRGEIPEQWLNTPSGEEMNRIVRVVVENQVNSAREEQLKLVEEEKKKGQQQFVKLMNDYSTMTRQDFANLQKEILNEVGQQGVNIQEWNQSMNQFVASILSEEFNVENIKKAIRKMPNDRDMQASPSRRHAPGTLAEDAFAREVQNILFSSIRQECPEIWVEISKKQDVVKGNERVDQSEKSTNLQKRRISNEVVKGLRK